jgi:hypothetical protein
MKLRELMGTLWVSFWEFGGNTKIPKNVNCLKFNFEIILMIKAEPVPT